MTILTRHSSVRAASTWLLAALLTVVLAACAQANTSPTPMDPVEAGKLYAQCMRDNGLSDFPDPGPDGRFVLDHDKFNHDDPKFKAATEKCRDLAPGGEHQNTGDPAYIEQMRKFSQCMRDNGLPDFPDPDANGQLRGIGHEQQGNPTFQAAMETCRDKLPGGGSH
jgi:hypothetical protein